jgi:hypothetical protein
VFLPVEIKEAKNSIEMVALLKKRHAILPEAKWVAEVLSHLIREFQ